MIKYFFGSVNLFKKQVAKEATVAMGSKLDMIVAPTLSREEIANFDQYYTNVVRQQLVKENGRKKLIQQTYTPNINKILQSKIGEDSLQILQFLGLRRDQLREEEVVFCLDRLMQTKQIEVLQNTDILEHIDKLISIKMLEFSKPECFESILKINKQLQFLSIESLRLMVKQLNQCGQFVEKSLLNNEDEEQIEALTNAFILAAEINYNYSITQAHLIHIRKVIKRNFKLLKFATILQYFITIIKHQQKLQTELDSILDIEEFFGENYNVLTLDNYITIIEHLALIQYKKRSEVIVQFTLHLDEFNFTIQQLAILAKSFAILEIKIEQLWNNIRQEYIKLLNLVNITLYLGEITLIFQSLLKISPISISELQIIYNKIKNVNIQESYTFKFQLLQNVSMQGHFNFELFNEICDYERNNFEFKYLNTYKQDKLIQLVKVFLFNVLQYSKEKKINEQIDNTIQRSIILLCNKSFEVINNPNYDLKHNFITYQELFVISSLFQKLIDNQDGLQDKLINTKLENIRIDSMRKLDKMVQRNQFKTRDALKLLGFIDYFQIHYKEEAYKELVQMVSAKLIEYENDMDQLCESIFLFKIQNKQIIEQFASLTFEKQAELTLEQLQHYSQVLKKNGCQNQELEFFIVSRSLTSNQYLNVSGYQKTNYEVNFLFN